MSSPQQHLETLKRLQDSSQREASFHASEDGNRLLGVHYEHEVKALAYAIQAIEERERMRTLLKQLNFEKCFSCDCGVADGIFDQIADMAKEGRADDHAEG